MLEQYGIPLWAEKLIMSGGILVGTIFAAYVVRIILRFVAHRFARKTASKLDDLIIEAVSKPVFNLIIVGGLDFEIKYLHESFEFISEGTYKLLHGIAFAFAMVLIGWLTIRFSESITTWYAKNIAARTETKFDDEFIPIFSRSLKAIVFVLVLMAVLSHFNIDVKGLVAVLGVSSLAFALAAQDTLANMIAGFILMLDRPFRVGDRVTLADDRILDVYEIGLRSTKFLTRDNTLVIIPNAEISKMTIDNLSYPAPQVRVRIEVGVAYGSDIDRVKELLLEAAHSHPDVIKEPKPFVQFINFGESSLDFRLNVYVADYSIQRPTGHAVRELVYKIFGKENIEIPFPQRVVYLYEQDKEKEKKD
ncbi:MAG: mechanosensitive ion channel domain-containing protein [candidate division Zixibacteria bacterium]